jgi:hypothetical protein
MKRVVLTLIATAALTLGSALPIASFGLTRVTLSCNDGTNITAEVDASTLTGLVQSVQALMLYPAGLSCTLTQAPVLHALGVASAWPGGGFIVGGGRFQYPCPNSPLSLWVNFAVSARTVTSAAGDTSGGTVNLTIPEGQCIGPSQLVSKPTCLRIFAEGAAPPQGAWYAYIRSFVTETSGDVFAPYQGAEISTGWKDTGNPGEQLSNDRVTISGVAGNCPSDRSPDPDGSSSVPILDGNVTISPAQ